MPPAYSPLDAGALLKGAAAAISPRAEHLAVLERTLEERYGIRAGGAGAGGVLLADSGTSALALAIRLALSGRPGSSVALPAYGCYDLATAADAAGAPVVLYDLDPATLAPDTESLGRALKAGAGAVVLVHLFGVPVDGPGIRAAAEAAGAVLIEDAAQACGATVSGALCGSAGPLTVLSFGRGKGWTGSGGGALLALSSAWAAPLAGARLKLGAGTGAARAVAMGVAQHIAGRPALYALPASVPALGLGRTVYQAPHEPRAMSAASAAIAAATRAASDAEAEVRRRNAAWLLERLPGSAGRLSVAEHASPSWLRLPLLVDAGTAARADEAAAHALGIYRGYPLSLADLPGFERVANRGGDFSGARRLAAGLITAPTHSQLTGRDLERVAAWFRDAV